MQDITLPSLIMSTRLCDKRGVNSSFGRCQEYDAFEERETTVQDISNLRNKVQLNH